MASGSVTPEAAAVQPDPESEVPSFSLLGKKAFVTGSSRGIGRAVALALASAGSDVAISCNTGGQSAEEVCRTIRDRRRQAPDYAHNVGVESEVEAMCAEVKRDFGTIDILVNNAAINRDRTFKRLTKEAWDEVINTDLTSVADQAMESVPAARRGHCTLRRRRRRSSPGWCSISTGASPCDGGPS